MYNKKSLKNETIEIKFRAMFPNKGRLSYTTSKSIDFRQEPPIWIQAGESGFWRREKSVVSPYLYKNGDTIYFFINYGRELVDINIPKCS